MPGLVPRSAGFGSVALGVILLLAPGAALSPARAGQESPGATPFTGYLKIRQQDGTLTYRINVIRGKVTSGIESHSGSDEVTADIVGGWFDRERLMLLIQKRGPDLSSPWAAHAHQFRRTEGGFTLEHTLYGYGKTIESGRVYRPHVIDAIVEVD